MMIEKSYILIRFAILSSVHLGLAGRTPAWADDADDDDDNILMILRMMMMMKVVNCIAGNLVCCATSMPVVVYQV